MGTHAHIGKKNSDGSITAIYLHYDGYESGGAGDTLRAHYTEESKVDQLIALGSLSVLGDEIGEKQDFNAHRSSMNTCLAYHRDRGEDFHQMAYYSERDFFDSEQYAYLFVDGTWERGVRK